MSRAGERESLDIPGEPLETVDDLRALFLDRRPLLDVRAPVEFQKGSFPEAVNLPLLNDEERHAVGVRYKQQGQDAAIELGARLLDEVERERRVAEWARFASDHPGAVLYCFRGGLRSRITQAWLAEAGVEMPLVTGGYKAMRSWLIDTLIELCARLPLRIVGGRTGVGKTDLIKRLGRAVDLEGVANHRGSSFGGVAYAQPGNIDFENRVAIELLRFDAEDALAPEGSAAPIWLEDEARLIGRIAMPESLVQAMRRAPIELLEASLEVRVENCLGDYVDDLLERYRRQVAAEAAAAAGAGAGAGAVASVEAAEAGEGEGEGTGTGARAEAKAEARAEARAEAKPEAKAEARSASASAATAEAAADSAPAVGTGAGGNAGAPRGVSSDVEALAFERFAAHHRGSLGRIRKRLGGDVFVLARGMLEDALTLHRTTGDTAGYEPFIELLLTRYYDPMYDYQLASKRDRVEFTGEAEAILARHA